MLGRLHHHHRHGHHYQYQHRATLVNLKPKWIKDRTLDSVVSREKHLQPLLRLLSSLNPTSSPIISIYNPIFNPTTSSFLLRRFPAIFTPLSSSSSFSLSPSALSLHLLLLHAHRLSEPNLILRLRKLLSLSLSRSLPLHTLDLLLFDLALPFHYRRSLLPRCPHLFRLSHPPNHPTTHLHLIDPSPPPISHLESTYGPSHDGCLAFPVSFTRGFGLKRKCVEWLKEWQTLPYTSPYRGIPEGFDLRTDVAEKRMVGVFHELLHLMVGKKTERRNVSNLRKCLGLPQKFTKVFERHPGIFYLSRKLGTQTVVLREAYGGGRELVEKHPVVEVREKWLELMRVRRKDMEEEEDDEDDEIVADYESSNDDNDNKSIADEG